MKIVAPAAALFGLLLSVADAALPRDVLALMDPSVDACDDFYAHACGNYIKTAEIPKDNRRAAYIWDTLDAIGAPAIAAILADSNSTGTTSDKKNLLHTYYASCMDTNTTNTLGNKPFQPTLKRIDAVTSKPELAKLVGEMATASAWMFAAATTGFGSDAPYNQELVVQNLAPPFDQALFLDSAKLSAERPRMRAFIADALTLAGVQTSSGKRVNVTAAAEMIIDTYKTSVEVRPTDDELNNDEITLSHSQALTRFPLSYKGMIDGSGLKVGAKATVNFDSLKWMGRVEKQLWGAKSLEDLKLFFSFTNVLVNQPYLNDALAQNDAKYFKYTPDSRATKCTKDLIERMPHLLTEYLYSRLFSDDRQAYVQAMAASVKHAMNAQFTSATWLSEATRKEAMAKVDSLVTLIGKSPEYSAPPVPVSATTFFDNVIALKKWNFKNDYFAGVDKQADKLMWTLTPGDDSGFYLLFMNSLQYPVTLLQPPFFTSTQHPARNFGSAGAMIASDMTSAFSVNGRQADAQGHQRAWFSDQDNAAYDTRADCLRKLYSAQVLKDNEGQPLGHVDGNTTVESNVLDNNAVNVALVALHDWMQKNPTSIATDGVAADEVDKLYFLSVAQTSCYKGTDAWLKDRLNDNSAPPIFSVNVPMMNSDAFAKTFQCKAGSKMNPLKKCRVW